MRNVRDICWWLVFIAISILVQAYLPGLDALAVGVIIMLQERDYKNLAWLLPLFILLQEGMGTRVFGGSILWYAIVILAFKIGRWLFEVGNFMFVFLLAACLGGAYFGMAWLLAPLLPVPYFDMQTMIDISLIQAIYVPVAWRIFVTFRPQGDEYGE